MTNPETTTGASNPEGPEINPDQEIPQGPPDLYTIIKGLMDSDEPLDVADFKETELIISLSQDVVRARIPTFSFSSASQAALKDFLNSEGITYALDLLRKLREHKKYAMPALCLVLVIHDFRRAIRAMPKQPQKGDNNIADAHPDRAAGQRENDVSYRYTSPEW